jgi:hypothetical protein
MPSLPRYERCRATRPLVVVRQSEMRRILFRDDKSNLMRLLTKWETTACADVDLQEKGK